MLIRATVDASVWPCPCVMHITLSVWGEMMVAVLKRGRRPRSLRVGYRTPTDEET